MTVPSASCVLCECELCATVAMPKSLSSTCPSAESSKFSGLTGESDPLLGNRVALPGCPVTSDFTMQKSDGLRRRVSAMPQFIKVRGGAYFFMPGIKALRYFGRTGSSNP